jgi:predicted TIM-barrel fold metal-dependent hydrolase
MCGQHPTTFKDLADLARLPWFELQDRRLVLKDDTVGPIIDMHTHLAMSFVRRNQLDLHRLTDDVEHYLPHEAPIDLEKYINQNIPPADLKNLKRDLTLRSLTAGGMRATHTATNLGREMKEFGVVRSVLLAIDYPVLSENSRTWLDATRGDDRFVTFGSVHPYARDPEKKLDVLVGLGAKGVKVHPNVQLVPPENARAMRLYRMCAERKLPIFWHCGPVGIDGPYGRKRTQVARYEIPIRQIPDATFVLGHAGALQMDQALELARKYDNVWMELSSQSLTNVRKILERGPSDRVVFGTDWPWYHQAIGLAKVLAVTEGDQRLRRKVLHDNAARLLRQ